VYRLTSIALIALGFATGVEAKTDSDLGNTPVVMTSYNALDNTFNGYLHVEATPCRGRITYKVNLVFSGAKDENDARAQVQPKLELIRSDVDQAAASCGR